MPTIIHVDAYTVDRPIGDCESEFLSNIHPLTFTRNWLEAYRFTRCEDAHNFITLMGWDQPYCNDGWDVHLRLYTDRRSNSEPDSESLNHSEILTNEIQ